MRKKWSYPSIIGMLLYLSTNTRPDIIFAVSQEARFTHDPKQSHATVVKQIVRYLARTADKGMIVKRPTEAINQTALLMLTLLDCTRQKKGSLLTVQNLNQDTSSSQGDIRSWGSPNGIPKSAYLQQRVSTVLQPVPFNESASSNSESYDKIYAGSRCSRESPKHRLCCSCYSA